MTQVSNRLRGFLTQIHPSLERVAVPGCPTGGQRTAVPLPVSAATRGSGARPCAGPAAQARSPLNDQTDRGDLRCPLGQQSVEVAGTGAAGKIIGRLAAQLQHLGAQRAEIEAEIITVVDAHPLTEVEDIHAGSGCQDRGQNPHRGGGQGFR